MLDHLIDDFLDRLACDGVALSVTDGLPIVDRFVNICLSEEGKWITIGGHAEGGAKHVGGFRVQINADGKIIKGRLKGTNVKDVKTRFDQGKNRGEPIREKEESSKMPHFMKNVKNTVDNSRKDAILSPADKGNTNSKGDKMGESKLIGKFAKYTQHSGGTTLQRSGKIIADKGDKVQLLADLAGSERKIWVAKKNIRSTSSEKHIGHVPFDRSQWGDQNVEESKESVKNTVDNSREDDKISGTAAKETAGNDDAKGTKMETAKLRNGESVAVGDKVF